ncbi:MAG: 16S rRNA (cytidine(1402)-2'-O)-methyltransferase [Desulfobacterium sp.]|jgi:16S rRNA (cytidine1402-2'-O)-methyltransferase|nr:16S rRNA (cytidine(1402)-2'-O)-methyltransferase [Desulfobacterium sp.]
MHSRPTDQDLNIDLDRGRDDHPLQGTLYVVATPIGNLGDITFRAVETLGRVSMIAAEDTRHTGKLLARYQIKKPLVSCHDHNETQRIDEFIVRLNRGEEIALVSDAGTPLVSDPGFELIRACTQAGIRVIPIPGPCAAVAGLSVSGLATDSFLFVGFLPRKAGRRRERIEALAGEGATLVFYESPRRILPLLGEMVEILGDRPGMVAREITKIHEEYLRGNLSEIMATLGSRESVRGECSLFVAGADLSHPPLMADEALDRLIVTALEDSNQRTGDLAKELAKKFKIPKKVVYERILALR